MSIVVKNSSLDSKASFFIGATRYSILAEDTLAIDSTEALVAKAIAPLSAILSIVSAPGKINLEEPISGDDAVADSVFVDSDSNILSYKDSEDVVHGLYEVEVESST